MHGAEYIKLRDDSGKQWTLPLNLLKEFETLDESKELLVFDPKTSEAEKIKVISNQAIDANVFSKLQRPLRYTIKSFLRIYDPAYQNTAVIRSKISFVDGENGILQYRGYNIEFLAEHSNYLETSFLLIYGHLPNSREMNDWRSKIMKHTFVHTKMNEILSSFNYNSHPMGMFIR